MTPRRIALVTCRELPDLDPDDRPLGAALRARGIAAEPVVWDDPDVDWAAFDLCVLRSPWDYTLRRDEFVSWARQVPRLANPAQVVAWNTDKRYLTELAAAGVPTVPTVLVGPGGDWQVPDTPFVVKPTVGAGGKDAARYDPARAGEAAEAADHVARLHATGRAVLIQPYLAGVDRDGETGVVHLGGRLSHAFRKDALLDGTASVVEGLYRPETVTPREAPADVLDLAEAALAAVARVAPPHPPLLYARVDTVPGPDGRPLVLEVELTEPSLFLGLGPGAVERFAAVIAGATAGATASGRSASPATP
ncbi:MAG: RimK family alpha-L-glutamate ligase [Kineosporiaceae bacterium]